MEFPQFAWKDTVKFNFYNWNDVPSPSGYNIGLMISNLSKRVSSLRWTEVLINIKNTTDILKWEIFLFKSLSDLIQREWRGLVKAGKFYNYIWSIKQPGNFILSIYCNLSSRLEWAWLPVRRIGGRRVVVGGRGEGQRLHWEPRHHHRLLGVG